MFIFIVLEVMSREIYIPNMKREPFKQSMLYLVSVARNDFPSLLKSASTLVSFNKYHCDKRPLRNCRVCLYCLIMQYCYIVSSYILLGAEEEHKFCKQLTQNKYIEINK